jgi:hypothetical protein
MIDMVVSGQFPSLSHCISWHRNFQPTFDNSCQFFPVPLQASLDQEQEESSEEQVHHIEITSQIEENASGVRAINHWQEKSELREYSTRQ